MPGRSIQQVILDANPNQLADAFRQGKVGTFLGNTNVQARLPVSSDVMTLGEKQKASAVTYAFATVGTVAGAKAVVSGTPATGQVAVDLNGNIVFAAADAVTEAEVAYTPFSGDLVEEEVVLNASGIGTLGGGAAAKLLLAGTVTTGAQAGAKTKIARGGAPTTAQVCLSNSGKTVVFNVAAAGARATVRYIKSPAAGASAAELFMTDQTNL